MHTFVQTVVCFYRWALHSLNYGHVEKGVCRDLIMGMCGRGDTAGKFVWSFCRQYYRYTYRGISTGYITGIHRGEFLWDML